MKLFNEVVFASPDVDADDFIERVSAIDSLADDFTLYASSKDRALQASRRFNGTGRRAGDSAEPVLLPVLNTIDTSAVSDGGLGHSDIFGGAFTDFQAILWLSLEPDQRCLLGRREEGNAVAWVLGTSAHGVLRPAGFLHRNDHDAPCRRGRVRAWSCPNRSPKRNPSAHPTPRSGSQRSGSFSGWAPPAASCLRRADGASVTVAVRIGVVPLRQHGAQRGDEGDRLVQHDMMICMRNGNERHLIAEQLPHIFAHIVRHQ
jgi:hypothetical protein